MTTWKPAFLTALAATSCVTEACKAAGINRQYAYRLRGEQPTFAAAWDDAVLEATDALKREARRRAYEGLVRKKFNGKGEPVIDPATGEQYIEREYSDALLSRLLQAHCPEFRDTKEHHHTGAVQLQLVEEIVDADDNQNHPPA